MLEVRPARANDVDTYAALGRDAQAWLQARGLKQYIPAAHDEYAAAIQARVESGTLYTVWADGAAVAFFNLDPVPSAWWPADGVQALYLAGIVVAEAARGRGIGGYIIRWCVSEAARRACRFVRLDCHADNGGCARITSRTDSRFKGGCSSIRGMMGACTSAPWHHRLERQTHDPSIGLAERLLASQPR